MANETIQRLEGKPIERCQAGSFMPCVLQPGLNLLHGRKPQVVSSEWCSRGYVLPILFHGHFNQLSLCNANGNITKLQQQCEAPAANACSHAVEGAKAAKHVRPWAQIIPNTEEVQMPAVCSRSSLCPPVMTLLQTNSQGAKRLRSFHSQSLGAKN